MQPASVTAPKGLRRWIPSRRTVIAFAALTVISFALEPSNEAVAANHMAQETDWSLKFATQLRSWGDASSTELARLDAFLETQSLVKPSDLDTPSRLDAWRSESLQLLLEQHLLKSATGFELRDQRFVLILPESLRSESKAQAWANSVESSEFVQAVLTIAQEHAISWEMTRQAIESGLLIPQAKLALHHPAWVGTARGAEWIEVQQRAVVSALAAEVRHRSR